ncbi:MAG: nuclear transport factor 2 family protein [Pseudohongiellaceae bacterium]
MKKSNYVLVTAMFVLFGGGLVWAQNTGTPAPLTGRDYEEIKALYARYNQGSDFRDTELFLSAFAEDAVMTRGGRDIVGMDALRADRAERYQGETGDVGRRHLNGSYLITPTEQGAFSRTYWFLLDVTVRPSTVVASGYYEDNFVRTEAGWRIGHRTLFSDSAGQ